MPNCINEDRFFSLLPYFFDHPAGVLPELAQNACRAGATQIELSRDGRVLTVLDNGVGADSPVPLVVLAESNWSKEVETEQMPAGWGLSFLVCLSEKVTYRSRFGSITLDCPRFLSDPTYRDGFHSLVDSEDGIPGGFQIEAILKDDGTAEKVWEGRTSLIAFPLQIIVNGEVLEKYNPDKFKFDFETQYEGNRVLVRFHPNSHRFYYRSSGDFASNFKSDLSVVWHGFFIGENRMQADDFGSDARVLLLVEHGAPVNPVLPFRREVKEDAKFDLFRETIRKKSVEQATKIVNDISIVPSRHRYTSDCRITDAMAFLVSAATQEELDRLQRFPVAVSIKDGCERDENDNRIYPWVTEMPLHSRTPGCVRFFGPDGKEIEGDIVKLTLDNPGIRKYSPGYSSKPSWLEILEEDVDVEIDVIEDPPGGNSLNLRWVKARSIRVGGEEVDFLHVMDEDYDGGTYVFKNSPEDCEAIQSEVFADCIYNSDGEDGWETQEECYREQMNQDIEAITERYNFWALMKGFSNAGVRTNEVLEMRFEEGKVHVYYQGGQMETLKVA